MVKEAHCSEKISKLLKEKGFNEPCTAFWDYELCEYSLYIGGYLTNNSELVNGFSAPTHQMACAWIREKGYHIYTFKGVDSWVYEVQSLNDDWTYHLGGFENHGEAIEAAIKYCLENLI